MVSRVLLATFSLSKFLAKRNQDEQDLPHTVQIQRDIARENPTISRRTVA